MDRHGVNHLEGRDITLSLILRLARRDIVEDGLVIGDETTIERFIQDGILNQNPVGRLRNVGGWGEGKGTGAGAHTRLWSHSCVILQLRLSEFQCPDLSVSNLVLLRA